MRISSKFAAIIFMFTALCAALTLLGALTQQSTSREMVLRYRGQNEALTDWGLALEAVNMVQLAAAEALGVPETPQGVSLQGITTAQAAVGPTLETLRAVPDPKLGVFLKALETDVAHHERLVERFKVLMRARDYAGARALMQREMIPTYQNLRRTGGQAIPAIAREQMATTEGTAEKGVRTQWTFVLLAAGALATVAGGAFLMLQRGVSKPLQSITQAMNRLAAGDLEVEVGAQAERRGDEIGELGRAFASFRRAAVEKRTAEAEAAEHRALIEAERTAHDARTQELAGHQSDVVQAVAAGLAQLAGGDLAFRIESSFPPGYETLRTDFNAAIGQLDAAMAAIASVASGLNAGADDISQSASDLSQRTEQQAATIEETAAALDQITTAVRQTAMGVGDVDVAVAAASADAAASSEVVQGAIASISEIQRSAHQISQIIGVIDEIAFQTNLLALNAGVEAARAGEAGRGFAVVATEVRALAQRSATAAKEIKVLISTSTNQVDAGVQLVTRTGEALERIQAKVVEIHGLMSRIAASAKDQATRLQEVNASVVQMDRITQQNAAAVEESTAGSFALASEAQQLNRLIARFSVGGRQDAPVERRGKGLRAA